jgi:SAM-dependent methyltransferase
MVYEYPFHFARFYDLIYHQVRDSVDLGFFLKEIRQTRGKILEIGVGTGRLFTEALKEGADIYGLDISPAMIDILLKKLDEEQHWRISKQNIIDFKFDSKFDLIIAPFRVLMHLIDKEDQLRALNNVYDHLAENGRFIFDLFIPDLNRLIHGFNNETDFEGEYLPGQKMRRIVSTRPDLLNQIINVHFLLEWEEENIVKRDEWNVPMRFFFRYELEHLVERSKFESYKLLGDYQGNELNSNSKEFVVICQKQ